MTGRSVLVLGGARSGKSRYAEDLSANHPGPHFYIATAQSGDAEMADRIARHRARRGSEWSTIEAPVDMVEALETVTAGFILIDCLTLWISNLMLAGIDVAPRVGRLSEVIAARPAADRTIALVSNEVGLGVVPDNALARRFRDEAGLANQRLAKVCDEVIFMAAGLAMPLKRAGHERAGS